MLSIKQVFYLIYQALLILFLTVNASQSQQTPFTTLYDNEVNNFSEQNSDLLIDPRNNKILIAGLDGIVIYNGAQWEQIAIRKTSKANAVAISSLVFDASSQRIYFGGYNCFGYLTFDPKKGYQPVLLSEQLVPNLSNKFGYINDIFLDGPSIFFNARNGQFCEVDKKTHKLINVTNRQDYTISQINKKLYQYNKQGVKTWNNKLRTWEKYRYSDQLSSVNPYQIKLLDKDHLLLLNKSNSFRVLNTQTGDITIWNESLEKITKNKYINTIVPNGNDFLIGAQGLLLLVDKLGNIKKKFEIKGSVTKIKVDAYGGIWFILVGQGIYYWEFNASLSFVPTSLPTRGTTRFNSKTFLYTNSEIFTLNNPKNTVKSLFKTTAFIFDHFVGKDYLYIATTKGVFRLGKGPGEKFEKVNGLDKRTFSFLRIKDKVIVGNQRGVSIFQKSGNGWELIFNQKLDQPIFYLYFAPSTNTLWASNLSPGIYKFTLSSDLSKIIDSKHYNKKDGLGEQCQFTRVFLFKKQLCFYNPGGIYTFKNDKFQVWFNQTKLNTKKKVFFSFTTPVNNQYIFVTSQNNQSGETGIITFDQQGKPNWNPTPFKRLMKYEVSKVTEDNGSPLISSSKGLIKYSHKTNKIFDIKYPCLIRKVTINDSTTYYINKGDQKTAKEIVIDYDNNKIRFEYALPYYEGGIGVNEYAYKIEGFDTRWSAWTKESKHEYVKLPEGSYTFQVKGRNVYGRESKITTFSFRILPPWYRTIWAYMGYGVLGLLFILAIVRVNSYRLRQQKRRLEAEVARQTHEILEQKEEISQQAEELRASNERLEELGNFRESLSHMLVHDAKQPLSPLVNSDNQQVRKAARRVLDMLENVLEVQKFESNEVVITPEKLLLGDLITSVIHQVRDLADEKLITIKNSIPLHLIVQADVEYITRVLSNLLGNAIKYIPTGSIIHLDSEVLADISFLKLWIKDNGPGISDEHKVSIFEKFGRIDKKNKRSTGLGLAFCKLAIEAHGGEIGVLTTTEIEAKGEQGAWFYFTIPLVANEEDSSLIEQGEDAESALISQEFTQEDHQFIKGFIPQLKEIDYYDAGKIMILLQNRDWKGSDALEAWIDRIPFADDEAHYQEMLQIFD